MKVLPSNGKRGKQESKMIKTKLRYMLFLKTLNLNKLGGVFKTQTAEKSIMTHKGYWLPILHDFVTKVK